MLRVLSKGLVVLSLFASGFAIRSLWDHQATVYAQSFRGSGFTQTFSVGSSSYVAVVAVTSCRNITVGEDRSAGAFPTADFYVAKPSSGNTPRQVVSGGTYSFMSQSMFQPGDIVGYVKLVSSSSTFFQDESPV